MPTVCIGRKGTIDKPYFLNEKFWCVDTLFYSIINPKFVDPKFVYYLFQTIDWKKKDQSTGVPSLTSSTIEHTKVRIPDLNNQEKIAKFLTIIDERINTQNKIIEEIISLKNSIIQQIFSNRGLIPNTNKVSLNKILVPGSKTPVDTSQYKKITIKLNYGGIEFSNIEREMKDTRPFYVRKTGELIIGKQNYFNGSIAILDEKYDGTICSNAIMSFIFDKEVDPVFVFTAVSNRQFLKAKSFYANGTGQKELSEKDFLNFEIGLPNINIQKKIGTLIENLDKKLKVEKINLELLMQQKQYLLANLFI